MTARTLNCRLALEHQTKERLKQQQFRIIEEGKNLDVADCFLKFFKFKLILKFVFLVHI